ncbi:putative pantothenate transporter [Aspergillus sclerotioniger CBS 115572]|uniref:Putative pantothenate transporter n=1 Tax=Aspergillus sclerotioniger CBS 115572 TaxID=1450535 RepID=A0A317V6V5_9EURO|nr:putative pantothenate transporter [Aspergillus sclerotioniger CBS 115572]PWY68991.1 putative pantothenate transporter [Aspergillus sclerotioniger CBS 115572]
MTIPHPKDPITEEKPSTNTIEDITSTKNGFAIHDTITRTPEEAKVERKLVLKIDLLILPVLAIIYFLAAMDRGDLSNASLAGMTTSLHLTSTQYANAVAFFYIGYIVFQLPGDIFLRKITPPVQLSGALVVWGGFTALLSTSQNYATLAGLRVAIGAAEAFVQAAPLYLTFWYKREQLASRSAIFFSMMALAGSANGLIGYGITETLDGVRGIEAWRWLFIVEGCITVAVGVFVLFVLPPVPEKLRWGFTSAEKEMAIRRSREAFNADNARIVPRQLLALGRDGKIYFYIILYSCTNVNLAALSGFLPIFINTLGYSAVRSQVLTIPIYACAVVSLLLLGFSSDYVRRRGVFLAGCYVVVAAGWIMLLVSGGRYVCMAALYLIAVGTYPAVILTVGWMNSNFVGFTKRAGALAAINIIGQCFSIAGSKVFDDPPGYQKGKAFALGFSVLGLVAASGLVVFLRWMNARKISRQNTPEAAGKRAMTLEEICDEHPDFMYFL